MGSITDMVNGMSVGGRVAAFLKCVCVYFVVWAADGDEQPPSLLAVAAKCAPVLCLLLLLLMHHTTLPYKDGWYVRRVCCGLALSALGDALLVWPAQLAAGMAAFGAAHGAYTLAFGWQGAGKELSQGAVWACGAALYCWCVRAPGVLAPLLPLYALALAGMAWRAWAAGGAARVGALLFVCSDALLGYSMFVRALPAHRLLVMTTYYGGQLGIALSALSKHPAVPTKQQTAPVFREPLAPST